MSGYGKDGEMMSCCVDTFLYFEKMMRISHPCRDNANSMLKRKIAPEGQGLYEYFTLQRGGCGTLSSDRLLFLAKDVPLDQRFSSVRLICSAEEMIPVLDGYCNVCFRSTFSLKSGFLVAELRDGGSFSKIEVFIPDLVIVANEEIDDAALVQSSPIKVRQTIGHPEGMYYRGKVVCETGTEITLRVSSSHPESSCFCGEVLPLERL